MGEASQVKNWVKVLLHLLSQSSDAAPGQATKILVHLAICVNEHLFSRTSRLKSVIVPGAQSRFVFDDV